MGVEKGMVVKLEAIGGVGRRRVVKREEIGTVVVGMFPELVAAALLRDMVVGFHTFSHQKTDF